MKHLLGFVLFCWMFTAAASAQQWTGSTDDTGSITRLGNVGIGLDPADVMSKLDIIGPLIVRRGGHTPKGTIAPGYERLRLVGGAADYIISLQDGTGRVQHYWNSTTGVDARYQVSNENAGRISFNPQGGALFAVDHAPPGVLGEAITWSQKFAVRSNGDLIGSRWLSVNSGATPSVELDVQGRGKFSDHLHIKNRLFVEGAESRGYLSRAALQINGTTADYAMAIQDGNGRVLQYWNANPGNTPTYQVANEAAGRIAFNPQGGSSFFDLAFAPSGNPGEAISWESRLQIDHYGNVGIGTTNPSTRLDVNGNARVRGDLRTENHVFIGGTDLILGKAGNRDVGLNPSQRALVHSTEDRLVLNYAGDFEGGVTVQGPKTVFSGNVGIGTTNPQSKLAVDGTIRATEVIVSANVDVPDYVFDDDYDLPTLEQVQAHIDAHGHLLDIPSAAEVEAGGIVMGELQMALLKKIEELTLYILEQEKRIAALEAASSVTGE